MKTVALAWANRVQRLIDSCQPIDETTGYNPALVFIITRLAKQGRPYVIHQLGCGVKRITTDTDTCPCCKRELP